MSANDPYKDDVRCELSSLTLVEQLLRITRVHMPEERFSDGRVLTGAFDNFP